MPDTDTDYSAQSSDRKKDSRSKGAMSAVGGGLQRAGEAESDRAASIASNVRPVAYKKGGKVRKSKRKSSRKGRRSKR